MWVREGYNTRRAWWSTSMYQKNPGRALNMASCFINYWWLQKHKTKMKWNDGKHCTFDAFLGNAKEKEIHLGSYLATWLHDPPVSLPPKWAGGRRDAAGPSGAPGRSVPTPHASCRAEDSPGSAAQTATHSHASSSLRVTPQLRKTHTHFPTAVEATHTQPG